MHTITTPMLLNALYEISFWSNIQYEHTIILTENIPNMPASLKRDLLQMRKEWKGIHQRAETLRDQIGSRYRPMPLQVWRDEVAKLVKESQKLNKQFINTLTELAKITRNNETIQLLLHHIYEESQYFMRILDTTEKLLRA